MLAGLRREVSPSLQESQFLAMQRAFDRHGGVATGDDVVGLMRGRIDHPISVLARWIVARRVISLEWNGTTLLPLFQFDLACMHLHAPVTRVAAELSDVFDAWTTALWFAQPNARLGRIAPVDAIALDPVHVHQAACADRLIAAG